MKSLKYIVAKFFIKSERRRVTFTDTGAGRIVFCLTSRSEYFTDTAPLHAKAALSRPTLSAYLQAGWDIDHAMLAMTWALCFTILHPKNHPV